MKTLKTFLLLFVSLFIMKCDISYSQVTQDWVQSYDNTQLNAQNGYDVATDTLGNIYVTGGTSRGYSTYDMVTLKYNSAGDYVWGKTYNASETDYSSETGRSIALYRVGDSTFIYSVGTYVQGNNLIIIKYNQNGKELWVKTTPTAPGGYDVTVPKVYADAAGNCFIAGGNGQYPLLLKYNSSGSLQYTLLLTSPSGYTRAKWVDMVLDAAGNIYLTGDADSSSATYYYSAKYNSVGTLQWAKFLRGGTIYQSRAKSIAVGASGVYVTGEYYLTGFFDYLTVKYNPANGDTLWTRKFDGTASTGDMGRLVAVDASENVFVTGITNSTFYGDMATIKYNSSGVQQWAKTYAGPGGYLDEPKDIAIDNTGNLYIAGESDLSLFGSTLAIKYNTNGDSLFVKKADISFNDYDVPNAMALDKNNNLVITGTYNYDNNGDIGIIKFNSSGVQQWMKKYYGAQHIIDRSGGVVTDKKGNVYVAGRLRTNLGDNICVIKYNSAGTEKWVYNRGGTFAGYDVYDEAKALTVDTSGNVYFTGTVFTNAANKQDLITGKLDSNGNNLWFTTSGVSSSECGRAIEVDNSGNVYVTGASETVLTNSNYMTVKYSSAGTILWTAYYANSSSGKDVPNSIAVDASGNIFVTGNSDSTVSMQDIVTVKYSSAGSQLWTKRYRGSANSIDAGNSIVVDKGGNAYVGGMITQTVGNDIGVIIKYKNDAGGTEMWLRTINHTSGTGAENIVALKLDTSRTKIYAAGYSLLTGFFNTDYTMTKYDSAGNLQWQTIYDNPGSVYDFAYGLALDKNENSYITGITGSTNTDILTVSYSAAGAFRWSKIFNGSANSEDLISEGKPIAVDDNGNVYVAGSSYDTVYGNQITVIKYKQFSTSLNLTSFIEGLYNAATNAMVSDTVKVYMRSTSAPYNLIDSSKGVLNSSGTASFGFGNVSNGVNYYIVVKHRNGLETWSSSGNAFTAGSLSYDFSMAANKSYGSNQIQADASPTRFAIFSGDVNQDAAINLTDVLAVYNNANIFAGGYVVTDLTGDNLTDLTDVIMVYNNSNSFVSIKRP